MRDRAVSTPVAMAESLVIPSRFGGPPGSGNGGYVCGRIAACLDGIFGPQTSSYMLWPLNPSVCEMRR